MTTQASTPMLAQYQKIKSQYQDCILFFRLGDFYEMFYDDAKSAAKTLDLVLTARGRGTINEAPMCGIPYHTANSYIDRLIKAGHKVAVCEQVEDPAVAVGIVRRDVIRVISSGTYLDENSPDSRYLCALSPNGNTIGIAFTDPVSGSIQTNQFENTHKIIELLARLPIYECVFPASEEDKIKELLKHPLLKTKILTLSPQENWSFNSDIASKNLCEHFAVLNLHGFGLDGLSMAVSSSNALLEYLKIMNRQPLRHINRLSLYTDEDYVYLSPAAHYGLEIETFFKTINCTLTSMGKRQLRSWLSHPLRKVDAILERQNAVTLLRNHSENLRTLRECLSPLPDLEKSISKLSSGYTQPKDLLSARNSLALLPKILDAVAPLVTQNRLFSVDDIPSLRKLLENAINPDMPLANNEGKVIKRGFNTDLDALRDIQENGQEWLRRYQAQEITRSKINSLKVGFNKVFGYYIEVTKANANLVPDHFIRKQTLVNGERFITPELKEYEEKILTAEDKIRKIENDLIEELKKTILDHAPALHKFSQSAATLDALYSLAVLSQEPGYVAPEISSDNVLDIQEGRHPVVEKTSNQNFIPNDTHLNCQDQHLIILTGPNMAGKSTYIRQIALLVMLSQMGSYVPAKSMHVGVVDKIFTRIGAHDDITKGQSTFMVEMSETADILNNLTPRSLVILDEIGRGTSTYDGLSLAWALAEHFQKAKSRTLFATHFHELTALANEHSGVKNYNVAVKEWKDEIIFLHKIVEGSTDDSYGIYVAKLAGVPQKVIGRAKQILVELETQGTSQKHLISKSANNDQLSLFTTKIDPTLEELKNSIEKIDVNHLTPLEALNKIQELKQLIKE
ncbi:MAG: DNA mismatch repair protein MutS [Candidatus Omnitrophica bacterium]|nr:DNA mismatch repair protein MutS [Candidatus Omnitrophota bacterium]